jgi:hypothetical protein
VIKNKRKKRNLRYYKDVINPNVEDQNYLSVFPSVKKKINISKIRMNSHELHSETGRWSILKRHGMKECVTFVTLRKLNMKITFS